MTGQPPAGDSQRRPPLAVDIEALTLPDDPQDPAQDAEPFYPTMAAWFRSWFRQVVERQTSSGLVWCPQWWRHNEAIAILDALWMAWEGARISPAAEAMLLWWERAIGMLHHLTSPDHGPFAACTSRRHQVEDGELALPHDPEPPGWFGLILPTGEPPTQPEESHQ